MELATKNEASLGRATWIMILRVACNLFSDSTLSTTYFTSHLEDATYRTILTQLLITSLLSQDSQIRQAAASLAYNCSTNVSIERLKKEEGTWTGMTEQEDDDWQVELLSAVVDALTKEKDEEICKFSYNRVRFINMTFMQYIVYWLRLENYYSYYPRHLLLVIYYLH